MKLSFLLNCCIFYCMLSSLCIYAKFGTNISEAMATAAIRAKIRSEFDWKAYLERYPDLVAHLSTREEAIYHYINFGRKEGRRFPKLYPNQPSLGFAQKKLFTWVKNAEQKEIPVQNRAFIIYFLGELDLQDSLEVGINNVRIFSHALSRDSQENSSNFYWFNILGGVDNVLRPYVPLEQHNVADVEWTFASNPIYLHFRILGFFKHLLETEFSTVLFLTNNARGPLMHFDNGQWIKHYQKLLFQNVEDNVGLAGPILSCEHSPHIQNHVFLIKTEVIPSILAEYSTFRKFDDIAVLQRRYDVGLSEVVLKNGYNISSLLYLSRTKESVFKGYCLAKPADLPDYPSSHDPTRWCDLRVEDVLFYSWGGQVLRSGFMCDRMKQYMVQLLLNFKNNHPDLNLFYPETLKAGNLLHLYKDYDNEMWAEAKRIAHPVKINPKKLNDKVCFMVRSCWMHDVQPNRQLVDQTVDDGIDGIIQSLLRQTDPNWEAIFFITDDKPFDARLKEILNKFNDPRVSFFDVPMEFRPAYSSWDAGYTPTDYVLKQLLLREDCRWLSATNADNIYGTNIVESVRSVLTNKPREHQDGLISWPPDMVLTPLDSRNFAEQDAHLRGTKRLWNQNCIGVYAKFAAHELGFTTQPRPYVGKVDLAAVFFSRPKLLLENVFFGDFTDQERFPCKGCQDGYFTEYLVRGRLWTYYRLPIDGMKSVVFHGPSPTWCLAGGNVWFDHPDVGSVRCYSQHTVDLIRSLDSDANAIFDWKYFDDRDRICLRFSNLGYLKNAAS